MSEEKILAWHFTEGTTLRDDSLAEVWRARRLRAEWCPPAPPLVGAGEVLIMGFLLWRGPLTAAKGLVIPAMIGGLFYCP